MRRSGDTFRLILRALWHASKYDNSRVLLVFSGNNPRDHAIMAAMMVSDICIKGFVTIVPSNGELRFDNGSLVKFVNPEFVVDGKWVGERWSMLAEDGSMADYYKQSKYRSMWLELDAATERNRRGPT